ncbi:hypothetical protein [Actinomadura sp. 7K507]|uniref:hypothetical protein n=1 Tax=Actinomadura sp. 7K507 TaxID=2530365 RepID=UPI001051DD94|nr:hypothetical protein [Actinomadura sp. 7K507]TDC90500.1 hypothetical protein E1285_14500 [Actinomadura sp. 7K507]
MLEIARSELIQIFRTRLALPQALRSTAAGDAAPELIGSITNDRGAGPSAADDDLCVVPAMSGHVGGVIALR